MKVWGAAGESVVVVVLEVVVVVVVVVKVLVEVVVEVIVEVIVEVVVEVAVEVAVTRRLQPAKLDIHVKMLFCCFYLCNYSIVLHSC